jgi:hypothetical protein
MAFMFKGPASLTSGSVVTNATSISSADLTVTDDLTVTNDVNVGDDLTVTGDIVASTITAKIIEPVLTITSSISGVFTTTDITDYNVLYLKSPSADNILTLTLTLTWRANDGININPIHNGHHIFIAWIEKHSDNGSIRINFNNNDSNPPTIYSTGTTGAAHRYLVLGGVGQHALFYYSSTLNVWMANESNNATFAAT